MRKSASRKTNRIVLGAPAFLFLAAALITPAGAEKFVDLHFDDHPSALGGFGLGCVDQFTEGRAGQFHKLFVKIHAHWKP
jgi:hypothetical protein